MIFLADFSVMTPSFGLLFWSSVIFLIFFFLISKFAFGPISDALAKREDSIQSALDEAKKARQDMQNLNAENERILSETRAERAQIIAEAKATSEKLINKAKDDAKVESAKLLANAKQEIESQKQGAIKELKSQVGTMAIDIAERLIKEQLGNQADQQKLVSKLVDDINLN